MFKFVFAAVVAASLSTPVLAHADNMSMFGGWVADVADGVVLESLSSTDDSGNPKPATEFGFGIMKNSDGSFIAAITADENALDFVRATHYTIAFDNFPSIYLNVDTSQDKYNSDGSIVRYLPMTADQSQALIQDIESSDKVTVQSIANGQPQSQDFDAMGFTQAFKAVFSQPGM